MYGNGRTALADAMDVCTAELEMLIDRHFAATRTLVVSNDEGKFWTAAFGDTVLYRSPDGAATLRFARTFMAQTPGVVIEFAPAEEQFSTHVDNVVELRPA
jgi:hypothetical protein